MKRYQSLFEQSQEFVSAYSIGEIVAFKAHPNVYVKAEILAVRFEKMTVWYDLRIWPYEDEYPNEGWSSILNNIRATLVEPAAWINRSAL